MQKFNYGRPASIKEACQMLSQHGNGAKLIAGGTDLMVQFREDDKKWEGVDFIVDLNFIPNLRYIEEKEGYIHIGPLTTHSDLGSSELLRQKAPFICEAALTVGSPQIRNRGTLGGSLCNGSPAADPIIPFIVLDGEVTVEGLRGKRTLLMKEVIAKPYQTSLALDEIVTGFSFKIPKENTKTSFLKIGRRKALAISRMNIGVALTTDENGAIDSIKIAPGCVFATPDRAGAVEAMLLGKIPDEALLEAAGDVMSGIMIERTGIRPSTEYKKPALEGLTRDVLAKALEV